MKTSDFLRKYSLRDLATPFNPDTDRIYKECSSVIFQDGIYYSYGKHYPLFFKWNGLTFCNIKGYSSSTAKHIHRTPSTDMSIKLLTNLYTESIEERVIASITTERDILSNEYNSLKRQNTIKAQGLYHRIALLDSYLARIERILHLEQELVMA